MSKLLDLFLSSYWAMRKDELAVGATLLLRHANGLKFDDAHIEAATLPKAMFGVGDPETKPKSFVLWNSVAIIPIGGVIAKRASQVNGMSQPSGTSAEDIRRQFRAARQDDRVRSVLLLIDSPGGMVAGTADVAAEIRAAREEGLPVEAFIEDLGASAAYWFASQASRITINSPTAIVGSIGVYSVVTDSSKAFEEEGLKVHLIASGDYKGGAPGVPVTDEKLGKLREEINALHTAFVDAIVAGRPSLTRDRLSALATGECFVGQAAIDAGLVDAMETLDAVLARLDGQANDRESGGSLPATRYGGSTMPTSPKGSDPTQAGTDKPSSDAPPVAGDEGVITLSKAELDKLIEDGVAKVADKRIGYARSRANEIRAVVDAFAEVPGVAELTKDALSDPLGCDIDKLRADVLDKVKADAKPTGSIIQVGQSGAERKSEALEAVLLSRAVTSVAGRMEAGDDRADSLAERLGYTDAKSFRNIVREARSTGLARKATLLAIAEQCATAATGRTAFANPEEIIAAAGHTSSDFPHLLSNVANKVLLASMDEVESKWNRVAGVIDLKDFKDTPMISMSEAPNLLLTPEGDTPERADFNERREVIRAATYTREFAITRQMIYNDDLSAFTRIPRLFGLASQRIPEMLTFAILTSNPTMNDGFALFSSEHRNLGSAAALSMASLQTGVEAMENQKGFGEDEAWLEITPAELIVPTNLKFKAEKLMRAEYDPDTVSGRDAQTEPNVLRGTMGVVSSPRLKAASATAWYLCANPSRMPAINVGFLNGQQTPTIVPINNGSILYNKWEVVFDCAASAVTPEAIYKNPGS